MKTTRMMTLLALAAATVARGDAFDSTASPDAGEVILIADATPLPEGKATTSSSSASFSLSGGGAAATSAGVRADADGKVVFTGPDGKEIVMLSGESGDVSLPMRWSVVSGDGADTLISRKATGPMTYLGLSAAPVTEELAPHLPIPKDTGLVVEVVASDSPAEKAGLQRNDIIARLDDQILIQPRQLSVLVANHKEGDTVKLVLIRQGKEAEVTATLGKKENTTTTATWKGVGGGAGGAVMPLRTFTRRLEMHPGQDGMPEIKELSEATAEQFLKAHQALQGAVGKAEKATAVTPDANAAVEKQLAELRAQIEELSRTIKQTGEKK